MNNTNARSVIMASVLVCTQASLVIPSCAYAGQLYFKVTVLPVLPNSATAINNSGAVAGSNQGEAYVYDNGVLKNLGPGYAKGINDHGQVTGTSGDHAFLYTNGSMQDLGTLGGSQSGGFQSFGLGINDAGQVTGGSTVNTTEPGQPPTHAFLYSNGSMMDLGTLSSRPTGSGVPFSFGTAINNLGQVTGASQTNASLGAHAFLYSNGTMQDLGTLGGAFSEGTSINDNGLVVGYATPKNGQTLLAFLYKDGSMQSLGTLGGTFSVAHGINDSGQIVGTSDTSKAGFAGTDAFLYSDGSMYNINSLIGSAYSCVWVSSATAINSQGQILAWGYNKGNHMAEEFLLTPTESPNSGTVCQAPEPGTLALFCLGLTALSLVSRRRALARH